MGKSGFLRGVFGWLVGEIERIVGRGRVCLWKIRCVNRGYKGYFFSDVCGFL